MSDNAAPNTAPDDARRQRIQALALAFNEALSKDAPHDAEDVLAAIAILTAVWLGLCRMPLDVYRSVLASACIQYNGLLNAGMDEKGRTQ